MGKFGKLVVGFIVLCVVANFCSGAGDFIQGGSTYVGSEYSSGRNTTEEYTFNIYNDGTLTLTVVGEGDYNYTRKYNGTWKKKSGSYHDKTYVWWFFDCLENAMKANIAQFCIDTDGNVYHGYGGENVESMAHQVENNGPRFKLKKK